jgi:hypothetical protein
MTIERGMRRLLMVLSVLILVPGAWISGAQFRQARAFHEWSTESGCGVPDSVFDWCMPDMRARYVELAALSRQAAIEYAGGTVALIALLWMMFYTLRRIDLGFLGPKGK